MTKSATVHDIIEAAGGFIALSYETRLTQFALHRWLSRGIPERHWKMLSRKTGLDVMVIARASERARRQGKGNKADRAPRTGGSRSRKF